ncbi:MAG: pyridoxamine 5'-phosphate oxidase family protein [Bacteroidota bacterium]
MKSMRRKDREITKEEAIQLLKTCDYGVLSTSTNDALPYGIPLSYCFINDAIYFHSALEGKKLDNFDENNSVSFCVVGETEVLQQKFSTKYESVIIEGIIEEVFDKEKQLGLEGLIKKYSPDFVDEGLKYIDRAKDTTAVFKIEIKSLTGKARR